MLNHSQQKIKLYCVKSGIKRSLFVGMLGVQVVSVNVKIEKLLTMKMR